MNRRDFIAAVVGLDRARWPVQPSTAELAINDYYRVADAEEFTQKPCIWVDSVDDIKRLHEDRGARRTDSMSVVHAIQAHNNYSFPGREKLPQMWFVSESEAIEKILQDVYFPRVRGDTKIRLGFLFEAFVAGAFAVFEYAAARYVISRPTMRTDERGRLHNERKPAVAWVGGPYSYYLHGVEVPAHWIERNGREIEAREINDIENAEVRRVVIEKFGWRKYLASMGAFKVDEDKMHGTLWEARPPQGDLDWRRGRMRLLELKDPSTGRKYFLRVPPNRGTARSARAWTFNKTVREFAQLTKET